MATPSTPVGPSKDLPFIRCQDGSILLPRWIYWISKIEYMIFIRRCQDWQIMLRCWISICSVSFFRQNCTQCTPLAIFNQFWFTANIFILGGRGSGHSSKALFNSLICLLLEVIENILSWNIDSLGNDVCNVGKY